MRYVSAGAFRQAIDARLKRVVAELGEAQLVYTRRQIVFDRLLARLLAVQPERWALKGGVALTFRLQADTRVTRDLDLLLRESPSDVDDAFQEAMRLDLEDFFSFAVQGRRELEHLDEASSIRYQILATLDGRRFDTFTIDIGFDQPGSPPPDLVDGSDVLSFAGFERLRIPTIPIEVHLAEKLHAYVRSYGDDRPSTRVKDLVDMVLIGSNQYLVGGRMVRGIDHTFGTRETVLPDRLPPPPVEWRRTYLELAVSVGINPNLETGYAYAASLFDPLLSRTIDPMAIWIHDARSWSIGMM